eukprot:6523123-Alexandrium_andersonii.AAC.1
MLWTKSREVCAAAEADFNAMWFGTEAVTAARLVGAREKRTNSRRRSPRVARSAPGTASAGPAPRSP